MAETVPRALWAGVAGVLLCNVLHAQGAIPAQGPIPPPLSPPSAEEKWQYFVSETVTPFILLSGAFNAGVSQATNSDPRYGKDSGAFADRLGASVANIATQNFLGDFVMASVLHEDTRYRRRGPSHGFWSRVAFAVSRSIITQTDAGGTTVNWSNLIGTAFSAGLSNAYYPAPSRTAGATALNWASSAAGTGFGSLLPEFLPDFKAWLKRHHL
jgi:hypothetical protein